MDKSLTKKPNSVARTGADDPIASAICRIRFVPVPDGEGRLRRRYFPPAGAVALENDIGATELATVAEPNRLIFVQLTAATSEEVRQLVQRWWAAGVAADPAVETTDVELGDVHIRLRPGRIVVESEKPIATDLADALIDLAYHEGSLRDLERMLGICESTAADDVPRAYRIRTADEAHWSKFGATIESLARMRLTFARLEPELDRTNRKLPRESRRLLAKLEAHLGVEDRLKAFGDRLEACEDLYESLRSRRRLPLVSGQAPHRDVDRAARVRGGAADGRSLGPIPVALTGELVRRHLPDAGHPLQRVEELFDVAGSDAKRRSLNSDLVGAIPCCVEAGLDCSLVWRQLDLRPTTPFNSIRRSLLSFRAASIRSCD